jgi:hypothetical protein
MEVFLFWAVVVDILLSIGFRCLDYLKPEPLSALYYDMTRVSKEELQSIIDESDDKTRNERFKEYFNRKPNYKPKGIGGREDV